MVSLVGSVFDGIKRIFEWVVGLFLDGLTGGYRGLDADTFGTPLPDGATDLVFGRPTDQPWATLYDTLVGGEMTLLALFVLLVSVQGRHLLRIFDIGGTLTGRRAGRSAWVGVLLIITWYWLAVVALALVEAFTVALMPDFEALRRTALLWAQAEVGNILLSLLFGLVGAVGMWLLEALFYLREVLILVYLYAVPVALALRYGQVPVFGQIARGFTRKFVPLLVVPLPAVVVFRAYDVLVVGASGAAPGTAFTQQLVAATLPVIVLYLSWKTFGYAEPASARVVDRATGGLTRVALAAGGGYLAGAGAGQAVARGSPAAAVAAGAAERGARRGRPGDGSGGDGAPSYRRTEHDPAPEEQGRGRGGGGGRGRGSGSSSGAGATSSPGTGSGSGSGSGSESGSTSGAGSEGASGRGGSDARGGGR